MKKNISIKINEKRLIKTFLDLVKIDSVSGEEDNIAQEIAKRLGGLKLKYKIDSFGNILSKLPGEGTPVLYSAHLDTVEPGRGVKPLIKNGVIKSQGKTILGADMKAGVAAILETLAYFKDSKKKHLPLEIVFTCEEETGLKGVKVLNKKSLQSKIAILFDGVGRIGNIAVKEAAASIVKMKLFGKAKHSGVPTEKGISAIKAAGEIIHNLPFGRIGKKTVFDIGLIKGGEAINTVAGYTEMAGVIRSLDLEELKISERQIRNTLKKTAEKHKIKAKIEVEKVAEFNHIPENSALVKKIKKEMVSLGIKPKFYEDMSSSEAGILSAAGIQAVNLGYGGKNDHTIKESITVKDLILMVKLLIKFCLKE